MYEHVPSLLWCKARTSVQQLCRQLIHLQSVHAVLQHMDMERMHQQNENADINGEAAPGDANAANARSNFPDQLRRRYEVYLVLPTEHSVVPMRGVTANELGKLVKIKVRGSSSSCAYMMWVHRSISCMASAIVANMGAQEAAQRSIVCTLRSLHNPWPLLCRAWLHTAQTSSR